MNNCTLALTISELPEVRYTANGDKTGQSVGEFYSPHHHEKSQPSPPSEIKIIAWGESLTEQLYNLEIGRQYIISGRLSTNTVERAEGFKEKRVELIAERIFGV